MKVGPHVMTHSHSNQHHHEREVVPRVGSAQAGGNLKLIQCQLMLLLHARRCQQRHELMIVSNRQAAVTDSMARALLLNCPIRHCRVMKEVLHHMKTCRLGAACTYQHCTTSLRILSHWTNCTVEDCPLCQCVRQRMRRAKEWEATLPRSSKYTLLAAALRSSQAPRPVAPNCHVAEQAQEGQSGVPCLGQDELRSWPNGVGHGNSNQNVERLPQLIPNYIQQQEKDSNCDKVCDVAKSSAATGKPPAPSLDQVRKAYEQLGIPCPEEALRRLMATLPQGQQDPGGPSRSSPQPLPPMDTDSNDQGVFDCSSSEPSPSPSTDSDSERMSPSHQQHPVISSTTNAAANRLPFKSSTNSRPI